MLKLYRKTETNYCISKFCLIPDNFYFMEYFYIGACTFAELLVDEQLYKYANPLKKLMYRTPAIAKLKKYLIIHYSKLPSE